VTSLLHLTPLDRAYPSRLRKLEDPPASITLSGELSETDRVVAVVGSRDPTSEAEKFAGELAGKLVEAGCVVASGGAEGIDAAAHRGALAASGRTWVVAGTGHGRVFPSMHAGLFRTVERGPGRVIWPFAPGYSSRSAFLARNRILVALADAVVVVQAGFPSGALHTATCALKQGKPLWVVPVAPWVEGAYTGSRRLLDAGARPLTTVERLLRSLGPAPLELDTAIYAVSQEESRVFTATSSVPLHVDEIAARAGGSAQATAAALLTLALENVVVEGPPGFFRRRDTHPTDEDRWIIPGKRSH
jgi:DNA processing protein